MTATDAAAEIKAPRDGVAFLLSQAGAHAAHAFAIRLQVLNLKPHDAGILRIPGSNPGITQQALSDISGMCPSRLVGLPGGLEGRNLIDRRNIPSDRRSYRLHLASKGRQAPAAMGSLTGQLEDDIFAALNKSERDRLRLFLSRIISQQRIRPGVHPAYRQIGKEETGTCMSETFTTRIHRDSKKNATGIVVPPAVVAALSTSKKPAVKVTLNGYTYRSTIATMGGKFMIGISAANREAAGLEGDEELEVTLEPDTEPRVTEIPADLKAALVKGKVLAAFENAAPSRRKEFVRQVEEAKTAETRERRITKIVESL